MLPDTAAVVQPGQGCSGHLGQMRLGLHQGGPDYGPREHGLTPPATQLLLDRSFLTFQPCSFLSLKTPSALRVRWWGYVSVRSTQGDGTLSAGCRNSFACPPSSGSVVPNQTRGPCVPCLSGTEAARDVWGLQASMTGLRSLSIDRNFGASGRWG